MRPWTSSPAGQLASVCQRYRTPWVNGISQQNRSETSAASSSFLRFALDNQQSATGAYSRSAGVGSAAIGAATVAAVGGVKYEREDGRRRPSRAVVLDPETPVERDERLSRLEAVLLLAREPLHPRKLSKFANLADGTEALTLVGRLNHLYDRSARAFRVEEVAGGWQLRTRPQFASWLRRLQHVPNALRLSAPAMETLAVVAYRQPVVRVDVEAVRGVACGEILRQLMERDLVRVSGRSDELGRPYFYSTTQHFLQTFGLRDLDELPRADSFRQALIEDSESSHPDALVAKDDDEDFEEDDLVEDDEEDEDEDDWDDDD